MSTPDAPIDLMNPADAAAFRNETRWQALEKLAVSDAGGDTLFNLITAALAMSFRVRWVGFGIRNQDDDNFVDIVSFRSAGTAMPAFSFAMEGSPCGDLYSRHGETCHFLVSKDLTTRFPKCTLLAEIGAVSYLGEAILDNTRRPVAHVLLLDDKPLRLTYEEIEFFRLISHRAGAEFRRYLAEQRIQAVMDERERVLASICHDISQTPLAAQLLVMRLKQDITDGVGAQVLNQLSATLSSMGALLDELRSHFSENANPHLTPGDLKPVHIADVFEPIESKFQPLAEAKGVDLCFVATSAQVISDATALRTILGNLVANAVSYTPRGRILVGCRRRDGEIHIEVHDTGIGITAADVPHVFDSYFRGENVFPVSSEHPGYGLGLSIVKRKLEAIGGRIEVESEVDKGSVFRVILSGQAVPPAA